MTFTFKVNGKSTTVDVAPDMPLLWVLRDVLDLKGTKFGCGIGQCGACTVHVKGTPTRACRTAVSRVAGSEITTIEGLSSDGSHPVQRAWEAVEGRPHAFVRQQSGTTDGNVLRNAGIATARFGLPWLMNPEAGWPPSFDACRVESMERLTRAYVHAIVDTCTRPREEVTPA